MEIIDSIILGIIEGFTEFLPVSSTGHLIVASKFLGIDQNSVTKAYEVIIQFAAILAVVLNYPQKFTFKHINLWMKIFVAFLPIAGIGFIFSSQVKELFTVQIVAVMFIVGGIVFLIVERYYDESKHTTADVEDVTFKQSLYIGIAQVFALVPGTSRAGSTIVGAMLSGLNRKASAEFSFLLAFPVMCATTAYDLLKHHNELFSGVNFTNLAVGFIISFLIAYLAIKFFLKFLESFTFVPFGIYRIIFGLILLLAI